MVLNQSFPTPHKDKLIALLNNDKLPENDKKQVQACIVRYEQWQQEMNNIQLSAQAPNEVLKLLIDSLNIYKFYVDVDLIFDSSNDFLYRQKGQLKLDNSVIEEFLPRLIHPSVIPEIDISLYQIGPTTTFAGAYFESSLNNQKKGAGLSIRSKAQDFAIARQLYLRSSHYSDFSESIDRNTFIAYVVAECKTNLDKTMFQESCATANNLRIAVSGAKYFLLCEWLDMTPISTAPTDIEEVLILRQAKRISANKRQEFSHFEGRQAARESFVSFLLEHPFSLTVFTRFRDHIQHLLNHNLLIEKDVLEIGYF